MPATKDELSFKKMIGDELPNSFLGSVLDWIRDNQNPEEVFGIEVVKKFIEDMCRPEQVFSEDELKNWAIEHGYTPPKKQEILSYAGSAEAFIAGPAIANGQAVMIIDKIE
jgi:hypothetical protein